MRVLLQLLELVFSSFESPLALICFTDFLSTHYSVFTYIIRAYFLQVVCDDVSPMRTFAESPCCVAIFDYSVVYEFRAVLNWTANTSTSSSFSCESDTDEPYHSRSISVGKYEVRNCLEVLSEPFPCLYIQGNQLLRQAQRPAPGLSCSSWRVHLQVTVSSLRVLVDL